MDNLFEGLKEGDLNDLVLPLVSIDEYESKLDDDSLVIAFFVQDKDPAQDLNRFIQKGATNILDTDVSPAPNEDGYFLVFVEILRDANLPEKIMAILDSLEGLTGIGKFKGAFYDVEGLQPVNLETLKTLVRLVPREDDDEVEAEDEVVEDLNEFFRVSDLLGLKQEGRQVTFEGRTSDFNLQLVDFGPLEELQERNAVLSQGMRLDETAQHNVSRLQALLGDLWLVEHLENHVVLSNVLSNDVALLRL